jgi:hypothetical protein
MKTNQLNSLLTPFLTELDQFTLSLHLLYYRTNWSPATNADILHKCASSYYRYYSYIEPATPENLLARVE